MVSYETVLFDFCTGAVYCVNLGVETANFYCAAGYFIGGFLLAVFSTILGHSIFSWCLKYFSPSFVSASKLCEPVVAAILAGFLFLEIPKLLQVLGGILIIGGVLYYSRIEKAGQKNG